MTATKPTTESKKLQTALVDRHGLAFPGMTTEKQAHDAMHHDARIAHEQREVMKRLAEAAQTFAESVDVEDAADSRMLPKKRLEVRAALDAAAPFLKD